MRRIFLLAGLVVIIGVVLSGCMKQMLEPQEEGGISITIPPRSSNHMLSVGPKTIPSSAEFIRVRIYSPSPFGGDFNKLITIPLLPEGSTTEITLPVGSGYVVSAISYLVSDGENYALTHDTQSDVRILPGVATSVALDLQPWSGTPVSPAVVSSGGYYSTTVDMKLDIGSSRTTIGRLYASLESFQDPSTPFPDDSFLASGDSGSPWSFIGNVAPSLEYSDDASPLYIIVLIPLDYFTWTDVDNPSGITLCVPNRYLGEPLHQIMVTPPPPPEGNLDLVIQ